MRRTKASHTTPSWRWRRRRARRRFGRREPLGALPAARFPASTLRLGQASLPSRRPWPYFLATLPRARSPFLYMAFDPAGHIEMIDIEMHATSGMLSGANPCADRLRRRRKQAGGGRFTLDDARARSVIGRRRFSGRSAAAEGSVVEILEPSKVIRRRFGTCVAAGLGKLPTRRPPKVLGCRFGRRRFGRRRFIPAESPCMSAAGSLGACAAAAEGSAVRPTCLAAACCARAEDCGLRRGSHWSWPRFNRLSGARRAPILIATPSPFQPVQKVHLAHTVYGRP